MHICICICICLPNSRNLRSLAVPIPQTGTGPRSALVRGPAGRTMGGIPSSSGRCPLTDDSLRAAPSAGRRHPSCHGLGSGMVYPMSQYLGSGIDPRGRTSCIARRIWSSARRPRGGRLLPAPERWRSLDSQAGIWADSGSRRRPIERRIPLRRKGGWTTANHRGAELGRRLAAVSLSFPGLAARRGSSSANAPLSHSPRLLGNGQTAPVKAPPTSGGEIDRHAWRTSGALPAPSFLSAGWRPYGVDFPRCPAGRITRVIRLHVRDLPPRGPWSPLVGWRGNHRIQ